MKSESPISADPQQYAGAPEFALPGRMRVLAAQILWDLINPCRQQLANADKQRSDAVKLVERTRNDAVKLADQAMASAEAKFTSFRDEQNAKLWQVHSSISSAVGNLDKFCAAAEAHLIGQGVEVSPVVSTDRPEPEQSDVAPTVELDALLNGVAPEKARLQSFCQRTKPAYWPNNEGMQWCVGIFSFIMLFVFFPLAFSWPVIIFVARLLWTSSVQGDYQELVQRSQQLKCGLQALNSRISKDVEGVIRATRDELIPPAKQMHSNAVRVTNQRLKDDVQRIENDSRHAVETVAKLFKPVSEQLHADVIRLWDDSRYAAMEWDSTEWKEWLPDPSPEFAARIGTLSIAADDLQSRIAGVDFCFILPALVPFAEGRCLLLNATGEAKDAAAEAIQSAAMRALANTPPGKARFTLIDPVGLGQNVADFMHLGDFNRDLINGKAWTEPQHIEQQLTKLTEDMETVIQTFLRKKYASIQEYNKEHHEVAEPFRFLVIFDFPVNFTDSAARRLVSIVKNGPRCGVYTLILMDSSKKLPYGFNIEDLRQLAVVFESAGTVSRNQSNKDDRSAPQPAPLDTGKDVFAVVLKSVPAHKKVAVIKALRSIKKGLDLAEAKRLVESAPKRVLEGVTKGEANAAKRELEEAGAIAGVGEAIASSESPPPQEAEVGKIYRGRVVTIKEFGAFVEFLPGKDGLVHITELANFRVKQTEDIVKLGAEIWVKCLAVDEKGRVRLSRKAAMAERETNLEA